MTAVEEYLWLCRQFELDAEDPAPSQDEADKALLRSLELWDLLTSEERVAVLLVVNPSAAISPPLASP